MLVYLHPNKLQNKHVPMQIWKQKRIGCLTFLIWLSLKPFALCFKIFYSYRSIGAFLGRRIENCSKKRMIFLFSESWLKSNLLNIYTLSKCFICPLVLRVQVAIPWKCTLFNTFVQEVPPIVQTISFYAINHWCSVFTETFSGNIWRMCLPEKWLSVYKYQVSNFIPH